MVWRNSGCRNIKIRSIFAAVGFLLPYYLGGISLKKFLSIVLSLVLILGILNTNVFAAGYNTDAAIEYAQNHWNDGVGLCAEFVSKCVQAGGLNIATKTGTKGCWDAILNKSGLSSENLILDSKGYVTKSNNGHILHEGDVVIQWCYTCDLRPHILLCGGYDSEGYATFYAHNSALNNKRYKFSTNKLHNASCNIGAKVVQISKLAPSTNKDENDNSNSNNVTPVPSTPAGVSLSSSTITLDYPNSPSKTITVTGTGSLPDKYKFELSINSSLNYQWDSSWSGNSINLTVGANQNSATSSTATIYLKDSSNDSVCAYVNFIINVSKSVTQEYIKVYFDSMGGSTDYATQTVEKYGTVTTPNIAPSRSGYTFLGWDTNPNATSASYRSMQTISVGADDIVLYAIWQKNKVSWSEWNLSVSKEELYFDENDSKKTVIVSIDEQDDSEFYFTYEYSEYLDVDLGKEYYDEHGYYCQEIIVYAPERPLGIDKVTIRLRDENHNIVDSVSFSVYLEENEEVLFADRNQTGISVYLNGEKLSFDVHPQIINSRTMVPMRKIFEELGTVVGWNNNTQTAISVKKGDVVSVSIGGQYLTVNGEQKLLDSPPVITSGRTLVPVRAIAESFNCDVEWYDYGASQVVDINMQDTINTMENKGGLLIGYSEFPPFSYYDDYGNLIGFDTELAKYVCDFWGWDCSFVEIPFDMKFVAINSGEIDCYWNAVTKTEERMEYATFTNEYVAYDYETEEDGEWYTSHDTYSVPFRKGDYDTVYLVNIALDEAQKDGTIAHLKWKYGIK